MAIELPVNEFDELEIPLPNGGTLCCGPADNCAFGGDVRIRDAEGNEVVMWTATEWEEEPELVMGAIFGASLQPMVKLLATLKRTRLEDRCWV